MKRKNNISLILSVLSLAVLVSFQNCGGGQFKFSPSAAIQDNGTVSALATPAPDSCSATKVSISGSCVCPAGSNDNGVSCVTCSQNQIFDSKSLSCVKPPMTCKPGYSYDGHDCVAISATCNSYIEVTDSDFVIPARTTDKVCYYTKLVSATTTRSDQTLDYVLSRNHDDGGRTNRAPSIIGQRSITFIMQGDREVVLSGDSHGGANIHVDNYILIEALFAGLTTENLWASGTGDVPPLDEKGNPFPIQVHGQPVDTFIPYGAGGIATFQAIDLAPILAVDKEISFIGSALDCGGGTDSSDAYLLFR